MYGTLISSVTVGAGGAASIEFTSIPQTMTDLLVVLSTRSNVMAAAPDITLKINGATTGYTGKTLYGTNATAGSSSDNPNSWMGTQPGGSATSNVFSNTRITVPNYTNTSNKTISVDGSSENNATGTWDSSLVLQAGVLSTSSPVTTFTILAPGGSFVQYSTAYLYGLTKGSGGATVS